MKKLFLTVCMVLVCSIGETAVCTSPCTLQQGTDGYAGTSDAFLRWTNLSTTNTGSEDYVYFNVRDGGTWLAHTLIKFDLSDIPATATITNATLSLYVYTNDGGSGTISSYRVYRAWTEAGADGDTYDGSNSWGTQGCMNTTSDRSGTTSGDFEKAAWEGVGYKDWVITQLVQDWVDGTYANNGVYLYVSDSADIQDAARSSDHATVAERPKLVITYTNVTNTVLQAGTWQGATIYGGAADAASFALLDNGTDHIVLDDGTSKITLAL